MEFSRSQMNIIRSFQKYKKKCWHQRKPDKQKQRSESNSEVKEFPGLKTSEILTIENTVKTEMIAKDRSCSCLKYANKICCETCQSANKTLKDSGAISYQNSNTVSEVKSKNELPDTLTGVSEKDQDLKLFGILEMMTSILQEMDKESEPIDKTAAQSKLKELGNVINTIEEELLSSCIKRVDNYSSLYQEIVAVKLKVEDRELKLDPTLIRPKTWHQRRWKEMKLVGREREAKRERKKYKKVTLLRKYKMKIAEKYNIPIQLLFSENNPMNSRTMDSAKQVEEVEEEEYLDDLIRLVHDDEPTDGLTAGDPSGDVEIIEILDTNTDNQEVSGTPEESKLSQKDDFTLETSVYGKKHLGRKSLSVSFFESSRNVQLLSECRPLSIQVIDYVKHTDRKSRVTASKTRTPPYRSYLALQKSSSNIDEASNRIFSCTLKQNNVLKIVNKNIFSDLTSPDTLFPVDRQITNRDNAKNNVSVITAKHNNEEIKQDTKRSAVAPKTTVVTKKISNIDFKRNIGLVGLKITNRIFKPESKKIPNAEENGFIGYKVLKTKCKEPKPTQIKQITDLTKNGNNINKLSNSSEKKCKTKTENCRKNNRSEDQKQIKSSTNVTNTVVSNIKLNCMNQIADVVKLSPALSIEENIQASENKDNFGKSLANDSDNKKLNEVSLKCKLKLDPQIASKFIDKINDEARTDQIHGNKHLSNELKVEIHTEGKSINICYPTTKTQNNDESFDEHTKEKYQKNNVTKSGDLKVQTVSQINNSVSNLVSSEIIIKHSDVNNDRLNLSKQAQIPEVTEIKTENEIKKEFDDNPDSSEISQNIFDRIAEKRLSFDKGIAKPVNIVETKAQANNEIVNAAKDPLPPSYNNTVDPQLLPPLLQNISVVRPIPPNVSSVRPISPNLSSVRPIPPYVSSVRPIQHNLNLVRPVPENRLFPFTPPANIAHEVNDPNSSIHTNPQFSAQPNSNFHPPNQGLTKTIDQQFIDQALFHHWQNNNFSANTNFPLGQSLAQTNEMHYHQIAPWQHTNDPNNINLPSPNISAYNNPQNPIAEVPMQWQQSVQLQNQMPFDMRQRNSSHIGHTQTCSHSNIYLNNTYDNSFNLLRYEGSLRPQPPPPPPSSQTLSHAICNVDFHRKLNQDKNINNSHIKKASLIATASHTMKLDEGHKILDTSKGKVSAKLNAKERRENKLIYVSSVGSDANTAPPKQNLKRAANFNNKDEIPSKIRLIPPQTSSKQFFRLTPTTCSSDNRANLVPVTTGYSPPILPIPTLRKSIELMRIVNAMQNQTETGDKMTKSSENPDKTHIVVRRKYIAPTSITKNTTLEKKPPNKKIISTHRVKKISLEEYKKRTSKDNEKCIDLTLDEKTQGIVEGEANKCIHDRVGNVERQSVESQDLGYDSDITVKL